MLTIIDFETYFDQKYNLKKMNMIEYIHDDRFEVLGAAILVPELNLHTFLPNSEFESWLSELDPNDSEVLAHNTLFDGAILAWHYGFNPKRWLDTLSMARAKLPIASHSLATLATHYQLPSKGKLNTQGKHWIDLSRQERADLTTYAKHDAWLCHQIYQKLSPFPETELELIDITIRLFTEPKFQLDTQKAHELLTKEKTKKKTQLQSTGLTATQLNSNQQLAEIIREHGLEPPTKISLRTGKETYAFAKNDEDLIEFIDTAPEPLQNILTARIALKSSIVETRLQSLLNVQNAAGSLPVPLTYHGAHTGRWSGRGAGLNMQNLPKKDGFREILLAPPGHLLVIADSASIEARVLAWLAEQQDLLEIFWQRGDPYKTMAATIYEKPETEITEDERTLGKVAVLGCIAEGEPVLTPRGPVPIEQILPCDTVWDGVDWVSHEGLIDQGLREVIYYDGLWATPDHEVFVHDSQQYKLQMWEAASKMVRLTRARTYRTPVQLLASAQQPIRKDTQQPLSTMSMPVWANTTRKLREFNQRKNEILCQLFRANTGYSLYAYLAKQISRSLQRRTASLHSKLQPKLPKLWGSGNSISIFFATTSSRMGFRKSRAPNPTSNRNRPNRQQRSLHTRKPTLGFSQGTKSQQTFQPTFPRWNLNTIVGQPLLTGNNIPICTTRIHPKTDRRNCSISNKKETKELEITQIKTRTARVYDLLNAGPRHRFTVSGRLVSNCGYGMGASKFQATAKTYGLDISLDLAQLAVNTYRQSNKAIVSLWRFLDNMIHFMQKQTKHSSMIPQSTQTEQHYKYLTFCKEEIKLPNGLSLYYPNLRYEENEYRYGHKQKTYGGALCIAGETNILTNNGLKKLINLNNNDLLWDGQNWVVHGGLIYKGLKQTINFGNIYMTPEHRVWTTTGWCKADETTFNSARQAFLAQSKKPTRLNFWQSVSNTLRRIKWPKDLMESRMYSLRLDKNIEFNRPTAGQILWMPTKTVHQYCPKNTWNDENPYLRYISKYDRPMQITYTPSLEKLRGARNRSRRYVEKFYSFLQRYVSNLPTRSYFRQNQQQWELFQGKLPLGNLRAKREQQTNKQIHRHTPRKNDYSTSGSILWNRNNHTTLSNQSGHSKKPTIHQTQCTKPVYDIMNSGPNHCFTVLNPRGEAILVHNCENIVQALARIVISNQVRATHKAGYPMALLVHDEIVCCVPETQAEQCSRDLHNIMCQPPDWAQDMPLDAKEVISPKYIKP